MVAILVCKDSKCSHLGRHRYRRDLDKVEIPASEMSGEFGPDSEIESMRLGSAVR